MTDCGDSELISVASRLSVDEKSRPDHAEQIVLSYSMANDINALPLSHGGRMSAPNPIDLSSRQTFRQQLALTRMRARARRTANFANFRARPLPRHDRNPTLPTTPYCELRSVGFVSGA